MDYTEIIRKIKTNGFMTETQIRVMLHDKNVKEAINEIMQDGQIHEVKYTNMFVSKYTTRSIYIFNPNKKRRKRKGG